MKRKPLRNQKKGGHDKIKKLIMSNRYVSSRFGDLLRVELQILTMSARRQIVTKT